MSDEQEVPPNPQPLDVQDALMARNAWMHESGPTTGEGVRIGDKQCPVGAIISLGWKS